MLALPVRQVAQDFRALFDDETQRAIASGLCVECRGARPWCGKARCPILVRYDGMMRSAPLVERFDLEGASPPGVFVGRFGYPKVYVGPLVPPVPGDTEIHATPDAGIGRTMEDIVNFPS